SKQFQRQMVVADDVSAQLSSGEDAIFGVMIESHLNEGRQDLVNGKVENYGQSITDACIGWEDTEKVLRQLADAVAARRASK
ncbi:MAG: 3-deoxy-7-phosphoheptulonate synthase, partial [Vibrio casei]